MLVPLMEIIAEALKVRTGSKQVASVYEQLVNTFDNEFNVLLKTPLSEMEKVADAKVVEGIKKVRSGDILIKPGYDGVFGEVMIWKEEDKNEESVSDQTTLF